MENIWQTLLTPGKQHWEDTHLQAGDQVMFYREGKDWIVKYVRGEDGSLLAIGLAEDENGTRTPLYERVVSGELCTLEALKRYLVTEMRLHVLSVKVLSAKEEGKPFGFQRERTSSETRLQAVVFELSPFEAMRKM